MAQVRRRLAELEEAAAATRASLALLAGRVRSARTRARKIPAPMKTLCLHGYGQSGPVFLAQRASKLMAKTRALISPVRTAHIPPALLIFSWPVASGAPFAAFRAFWLIGGCGGRL